MTFKEPDCPICHNSGIIYKLTITDPVPVNLCVPPTLPPSASFYTKEEVYCDCHWGERVEILDSQMRHPEYVNPFSVMSDEEIIATLTRMSDNQRAVDAEFNV